MIKVTQAWLCIPPFNPVPFWVVSSSDKEKPWYQNFLVLTDFGKKLAKNLMLTDCYVEVDLFLEQFGTW